MLFPSAAFQKRHLPGFQIGSKNLRDLPASCALTILYAALGLVAVNFVIIKTLKYIAAVNLGDIHTTVISTMFLKGLKRRRETVHITLHPRLRLPHTSSEQMAERHSLSHVLF